MAIPWYDGIRKVRHELIVLLFIDFCRYVVVVSQPIVHSVDVLQTCIERFQVRVMLETSLHDLVIVSAGLDIESEAVDISAVVNAGGLPSLLGSYGDEEGVPDRLDGGAGIF